MSIFAMPLEFFFGQKTYVCSRLSTLHHDAESLELLTTAHAGRLLRDLSFLGEHQIARPRLLNMQRTMKTKRDHGLSSSGELDDETRDKLRTMHGS